MYVTCLFHEFLDQTTERRISETKEPDQSQARQNQPLLAPFLGSNCMKNSTNNKTLVTTEGQVITTKQTSKQAGKKASKQAIKSKKWE